MGSLFTGTDKTTTEATPWKPQGDALKNIFSAAGRNFENRSGTPWFEGELFAGMDPSTVQSINGLMDFARNRGSQNVDQMTGVGTLADPRALQGAIGNFASAAGQDPTQANINAASAYANNPAINGMIDAASRDVSRNLFENEIPGINRAGTATGNVNSSRAGVAEGVARRGAADRVADISSNIRGDAFNRGLSMAESARTSNMGALGQAAGLYGDATRTGMSALESGNRMGLGNFGAQIDASRLFQQDRQGQLDANFRQWQGNDTREDDLLARYYGLVGANNWGGTQTTTQQSTPSLFSSILGAGSLAAGFGLFGGGGKAAGAAAGG
jgi:hypothetical protein